MTPLFLIALCLALWVTGITVTVLFLLICAWEDDGLTGPEVE